MNNRISIEKALSEKQNKKETAPQSSSKQPEVKIAFADKTRNIKEVLVNAFKQEVETDSPAASSSNESKPVSKEIQAKSKALFHIPKPPQRPLHSKKKKQMPDGPAPTHKFFAIQEQNLRSLSTTIPLFTSSSEVKPLYSHTTILTEIEEAPSSIISVPLSEPKTEQSVFTEPLSSLMSVEAFSQKLKEHSDSLNQALLAYYQLKQLSSAIKSVETQITTMQSTDSQLETHALYEDVALLHQEGKTLLSHFLLEKTDPLLANLYQHFKTRYTIFHEWITGLMSVPVPPMDASSPILITHHWLEYYQYSYSALHIKQSLGMPIEANKHYVSIPRSILTLWPEANNYYLVGDLLTIMLSNKPINQSISPIFIQLTDKQLKDQSFYASFFTINLLFCAKSGLIIDPTGCGYQDFKDKHLRLINNSHIQFKTKPEFILQAIDCLSRGFTAENNIIIAIYDWVPTSKKTARTLNDIINKIRSTHPDQKMFDYLLNEYNISEKLAALIETSTGIEATASSESSRRLSF